MPGVLWSNPLWCGTIAAIGAGVAAWFFFTLIPSDHQDLHVLSMTLVMLQSLILVPWWPLFRRAVRASSKVPLVGKWGALAVMAVAVAVAALVSGVYADKWDGALLPLGLPILIIHVAAMSIMVQTPSLAGSWMIGILAAFPFVLVGGLLADMPVQGQVPPVSGLGILLLRIFECVVLAAVLGPAVRLSFAVQHLERTQERGRHGRSP